MLMWSNGSCPEGSACRCAHSNDEIMFHPLTYKTQPCEYLWDAPGPCAQRGPFCPKVRMGEDEKVMGGGNDG